jgi:hypothetical protein
MSEPQNKAIKAHLLKGFELTHLQAERLFGCTRLAARVHDLKAQGCDIESRWLDVGDKSFKAYRMRIDRASLAQSVGL